MTDQSPYDSFLFCRDAMSARFSLAELEELCWEMGVDPDGLPHETPLKLATELLIWAFRRDQRAKLLHLLNNKRPSAGWPVDYSCNSKQDASGTYYPRSVTVPIVVVAMSREQAESLVQNLEQPGDHPSIVSSFQSYSGFQSTDWIEHYDQEPDDWKPFYRLLPLARSIREIITNVIDEFNAEEELNKGLLLEPRFMTSDFLSEEHRFRTVESLENRRGILIIDPLSLQHPEIMDMLVSSQVLGSPTVSTIMINPLDQSPLDAHTAVQSLIQTKLQRFYDRFSRRLDLECEYGGEDIINLRRWLLFRLVRLGEEARILPGTRQLFYKREGIEPNSEGSKIADYMRRQRR